MRARGSGQILQISSVLGFVGLPYSAAYVASKHAVNGLVKSLQAELRGTGVRVWATCPGRTESEFSSVALGQVPTTDHGPRGEPTERVVRAIVRGLDRRGTFLLPSPTAWAVVQAAHWFPAPFDWLLRSWAPGHFRREIAAARRDSDHGPNDRNGL
jgi:short-subunit dehydrogenase